jgi:outer membrane protein OmpA-like peptidoglycan-associated protein
MKGKQNTNRKLLMSVLILGFTGCATKEKVSNIDPSINTMLTAYQNNLENHRDAGATLLSPDHYNEAMEIYTDAKEQAYRGDTLVNVKKTLDMGDKHFMAIDENMKVAKVHLKDVIAARNEAIEEGANNLEIFQDAEEELTDLGEEIEEEDVNEVIDSKEPVRKMYVEAEIRAIQKRELKRSRQRIEKAGEMSGIYSFDSELDRAKRDIKSAEKLISKFKDSPARYHTSVLDAEDSSKRLYALVSTASWIEDNPTRNVAITLDKDLNETLKPLHYKKAPYLSYDEKMKLVREETGNIPYLMAELDSSQYDSYLQKKRLKQLENEKKSINKKLTKKQKLEQKVTEVQKLFDRKEAEVIIEGDDLIIRLVGLNFATNKTDLPAGSEELLKKVAKTARGFDYPDVEIIGHADSRGDALYNEKLSKERALTVNKFLVENTGLKENEIKVRGVGFREPVAENKTNTGRKKNRRIDVVFNSVVSL